MISTRAQSPQAVGGGSEATLSPAIANPRSRQDGQQIGDLTENALAVRQIPLTFFTTVLSAGSVVATRSEVDVFHDGDLAGAEGCGIGSVTEMSRESITR